MSTNQVIKYGSLIALTAWGGLLGILLQGSASIGYSPATVVLVTEIFKGFVSFCVSFKIVWSSTAGEDLPTSTRLTQTFAEVRENVFTADSWKIAVPAALYVVGNNLVFVAAANLDLPSFQVTYNLKILTTALLSVILLKKQLKATQWGALCTLVIGVAAVQVAASQNKAKSPAAADRKPLIGLLAVFVACCAGGFAGVYFEKVLKGTKTDLWSRNIQMSFFSLLPALVTSVASPKPMFINFGFMALVIVFTTAMNGIITAVVIKYADNILKGFTAALAVLLAAIFGMIFFDFAFSFTFAIGAILVVAATVIYGYEDTPAPAKLASQDESARDTYVTMDEIDEEVELLSKDDDNLDEEEDEDEDEDTEDLEVVPSQVDSKAP